MPTDCHFNSSGCLVCPHIDAQPAVPAYEVRVPVIGWDAGANSSLVLSGDMRVYDFSVTLSGALVVGFKTGRTQQHTPELIAHGLLFQAVGALRYVRVVEYGIPKTSFVPFALNDTFEIRRAGTTVTYYKQQRLMYESDLRSVGSRLVNACLYVSGDTIT